MLETYHQRTDRFRTEIETAEAKSLKASNRRGLIFIAALACVVVARYGPLPQAASTVFYALGPILIVVFIGLVIAHRRITDDLERLKHLKELNTHAAARLHRNWDECPVPPTPVEFKGHATAKDLDLFGPASLFHLLNTAITPGGRERLADWLSNPTDPAAVAERQPAVRELAPKLDWRQELHFAGRQDDGRVTAPDR